MSPHTSAPYGLLVIGSGPAGVHAAAAYVAADGPGAVCLVSTDVDQPYERPPLSKAVLTGEQPPEGLPILEDDLALALVELRLGTTAVALDTARRVVRTDDGREVGYERLVLATGADATPLPGAHPDARVHGLRSLAHGRRLVEAVESADSAVVVGSGFIGCEAAASLAARGVRTTLVTPDPVPQAARLGEWAGERVAAWLRAAGVELRTGRSVDGVEPPGRVRLDDGSTLEPDVVLAAVGVTQERDVLEGSGLATESGRLVVEETLRTTDPRVWGAGDAVLAQHAVVGRPLAVEHWGDAITMGGLAGRNAAADATGTEPDRWDAAPGFWSEIGPHVLKYSAWGDGYDHAEPVDHGGGAFTVWYADAAGELVGVLTHERDEDYERCADLLARRAPLSEALA